MVINTGIDPDAAFATGVAHRLALSLATLVVDQTLLSESDVPFEPFAAAFAVDQRLGINSFREALGFESTRRVDMSPASDFFERVTAIAQESGDRRAEQVFATLELVMRGSLRSLHQAFVRGDGVVAVPFFLFGRLNGGPLVGLRSVAIET
jgi:Nuclease A inhibitor-like protein